LSGGKGRSLILIPNAEHITILFRNASHQAALKWLNATFRLPPTNPYIDRRMLWYGLHLVAWLILLGAVAPALTKLAPESEVKIHPLRSWGGLLLAPFLAGGVLLLLSRVIKLDSLGGLQVGGAVGIWFFVAGMVWLGVLFRLPRPTGRSVGIGIVLFMLFWVAFGAIAQIVWLQWWLIPGRLIVWPLLSLACFPWFFASGIAQQNAGLFQRVAFWLWQSLALVGGFILVLYLVPELGFIFLLLPLFPPLMAILSFTAGVLNQV
jgi:hypothetical protein